MPTLSLLLGVPIPFSNLGMIIPELFLFFNGSTSTAHHEDGFSGRVTNELLSALRTNAQQIHNYLETYSQYSGDIPPQTYHTLSNALHHTLALHDGVINNEKVSAVAATEVAKEYVSYMKSVRRMCHLVWAKFDDVHIWYGLVLILLSVAVGMLSVASGGRVGSALRGCWCFSAPIGLVLAGGSADGSLRWAVFMFVYWTLVLMSVAMLWRMRCSVMMSSLCHPVSMMSSLRHPVTILSGLAVVMAGLYAGSFLSNSFILYEGDMLIFFLQTLIVCFAILRLRVELTTSHHVLRTLVSVGAPCVALMVCLRATKVFYSCRDLQFQDGCEDTTFISSLESIQDVLGVFGKWRLLLSCVSVVAVPVVLSQLVTGSKMSKLINRWSLGLLRFGLPAAGVCVACYWSLQLLPATVTSELSYWEHVALPWAVYVLGCVAIASVVWRPLAASSKELTLHDELIRQEAGKQAASTTDNNLDSSTLVNVEQTVCVVVIIVLASVWLPLAMLLNDSLALSAVLTITQAFLSMKVLSRVESSECC